MKQTIHATTAVRIKTLYNIERNYEIYNIKRKPSTMFWQLGMWKLKHIRNIQQWKSYDKCYAYKTMFGRLSGGPLQSSSWSHCGLTVLPSFMNFFMWMMIFSFLLFPFNNMTWTSSSFVMHVNKDCSAKNEHCFLYMFWLVLSHIKQLLNSSLLCFIWMYYGCQ